MSAKIKRVGPPKCFLCNDTGRIYRAYLEPDVSYQRAKDLVPCSRCNTPKESELKNDFVNNFLNNRKS